MPYLADKKYLEYKGFQVVDEANPYFLLMYLPFYENEEKPYFKECTRGANIIDEGLVLYYSNQCPFTAKYVPLIQSLATKHGIDLKVFKYSTTKEAQNALIPFTTYSLFYKGKFITHEILSEKKFEKLLVDMKLI